MEAPEKLEKKVIKDSERGEIIFIGFSAGDVKKTIEYLKGEVKFFESPEVAQGYEIFANQFRKKLELVSELSVIKDNYGEIIFRGFSADYIKGVVKEIEGILDKRRVIDKKKIINGYEVCLNDIRQAFDYKPEEK